MIDPPRRGEELGGKDFWVNGLPGGESQTGQEHAVKAGVGGRRLWLRPARPARYGDGWIAETSASGAVSTRPLLTTSGAGPPG